jgi:methionine-rich copper-binding protein CopC
MFKTFISTATLALTLAAPSFGHAKLLSSAPASGAQVAEVPKAITLTFNEEAKLAALTLLHAGKETSVAVDKSAPAAKSMVVPVTGLVPGTYDVHWTAIATDDGHVTKGHFSFTIVGSAPAAS